MGLALGQHVSEGVDPGHAWSPVSRCDGVRICLGVVDVDPFSGLPPPRVRFERPDQAKGLSDGDARWELGAGGSEHTHKEMVLRQGSPLWVEGS